MAVSAANIYPSREAFKDWPERTYRQIQSDPLLYGVHFEAGGNHFLKVLRDKDASGIFGFKNIGIVDKMVFCRIYDEQGSFITEYPIQTMVEEPGKQPIEVFLSGKKFLEITPGENYPDWKIEFYFRSSTFSDAAKRQKVIYIWTGVLLILRIQLISATESTKFW